MVTNAVAYEATGNLYFDYMYDHVVRRRRHDCTSEDGGREVVWPAQTFGERRGPLEDLCVPQGSPAFVRQLWFFENVSQCPRDPPRLPVRAGRRTMTREVVTTSSGDDDGHRRPIDWLTWTQQCPGERPDRSRYVWQGDGQAAACPADHVYQDCCNVADKFDPVADAGFRERCQYAGDRCSSRRGRRRSSCTSSPSARRTPRPRASPPSSSAAPDYLFAGMTPAEVRAVQNFQAYRRGPRRRRRRGRQLRRRGQRRPGEPRR